MGFSRWRLQPPREPNWDGTGEIGATPKAPGSVPGRCWAGQGCPAKPPEQRGQGTAREGCAGQGPGPVGETRGSGDLLLPRGDRDPAGPARGFPARFEPRGCCQSRDRGAARPAEPAGRLWGHRGEGRGSKPRPRGMPPVPAEEPEQPWWATRGRSGFATAPSAPSSSRCPPGPGQSAIGAGQGPPKPRGAGRGEPGTH